MIPGPIVGLPPAVHWFERGGGHHSYASRSQPHRSLGAHIGSAGLGQVLARDLGSRRASGVWRRARSINQPLSLVLLGAVIERRVNLTQPKVEKLQSVTRSTARSSRQQRAPSIQVAALPRSAVAKNTSCNVQDDRAASAHVGSARSLKRSRQRQEVDGQ